MKRTVQGIIVGLFVVGSAVAVADVKVKAALCNKAPKPVEFHFFNHNDILGGVVAHTTKVVHPCACVTQDTHTDLWQNFPIARINQLVYRDVGSVSGANIKLCVDVGSGKAEGYIDAKANTCAEAKIKKTYSPVPELTRAQGDLVVLQNRLFPDSTKCERKDRVGNCIEYKAEYTYKDGAECRMH